MTSSCSPFRFLVNRHGKRLAAVLLAAAGIVLPASAQTAGNAMPLKRIVIPSAFRIDLSHTGIHTHANYLLFDTGGYDLAAMQHDPAKYPRLTVRAHSSLPTDHAALPPDIAMYSAPGDPPLENPYGPIDGGPGKTGWTLLPLHQNGRNFVKVLAPTRFANWLALQPRTRRKQYLMPSHYTLEMTWAGISSPTDH